MINHHDIGIGSGVNFKHGMSGTATYNAWTSMVRRCENPKAEKFKQYGGRGIKVCQRWKSFELFLADMGEAPPGLTLERNDVNGDYEPSNCRWATAREQMQNLRKTIHVMVNGERVGLREGCRLLGLNYRTIQSRINILGMDPQSALELGWNRKSRKDLGTTVSL
jgi:hypothetical protein